jgi:hypothetical protein
MTGRGVPTGGKKNERIRRTVACIEGIKERFGLPYKVVLAEARIGYASFMRWRRRIIRGEPPLKPPGPQKVMPLNLRQLKRDIDRLPHGRKRTRQAGAMAKAHGEVISRRELGKWIGIARKEKRQGERAAQCRVVWHRPDLVWAMDGCRFRHRDAGETLHVHNVQDLCSRYKFPPLATGSEPCGEEVAGHLACQFTRFGPPLFCKRDNGGIVNHLAVEALLEETLVIPINSPVYTAPYNGAIEHSQGELKGYLGLWRDKAATACELARLAETAAHDLNHRCRRSLDGRTSCQAYFGGRRVRYGKRERRSIYDWIQDLAIRISEGLGKTVIDATAWRIAAKVWMVKQNLVTILRPGKVSPNLSPILCHN